MTIYQKNLIHYFRQYAQNFTQHLLVGSPEKVTVINDVLPHIIKYLDNQLQKDMALYEFNTIGYNHHIDILIELHMPMDDELKVSLIKAMNSAFVH